MRKLPICSRAMGHSQNVSMLKMLHKITLKLCVGVHETYVNFIFRLGSHTQDIPLGICRYSKSEKKNNLEALQFQAGKDAQLKPVSLRVSLGPTVFH